MDHCMLKFDHELEIVLMVPGKNKDRFDLVNPSECNSSSLRKSFGRVISCMLLQPQASMACKVAFNILLILHEVFGTISYQGEGLFIAGGAGVTPFISLFRSLKSKNEIG